MKTIDVLDTDFGFIPVIRIKDRHALTTYMLDRWDKSHDTPEAFFIISEDLLTSYKSPTTPSGGTK